MEGQGGGRPPGDWNQPPAQQPPVVYVTPPVAAPTNGLAVASFVLGILWLFWLGSFLAVIFGHVALSQIKASGGVQQGKGMAIAGLTLGWVGVGFFVLFVILPLLGAATSAG